MTNDGLVRFNAWLRNERPTILQENQDLAVCWQVATDIAIEVCARVAQNTMWCVPGLTLEQQKKLIAAAIRAEVESK